jgi:hypothetical protein
LLTEVFPGARLELDWAGCVEQRDLRPSGTAFEDASDLRYGYAGDPAWEFCASTGGEEQLVIFASVQRVGQGGSGRDGQRGFVNLCGYAGFRAEAHKIEREPIAQVHGGGCGFMSNQPESLCDSRFGEEMGF